MALVDTPSDDRGLLYWVRTVLLKGSTGRAEPAARAEARPEVTSGEPVEGYLADIW